MFHLTADHFETASHPRETGNRRQPFLCWVDVVEQFCGTEVASVMLNQLASLYPDDPLGTMWSSSPDINLASFLTCLEPFRGEQWNGGTRSVE